MPGRDATAVSLPDAAARARAVDPQRCVCISAPAGSGKTGLLIQRFLALLSRVAEPERIVAITFTRKAAAEMRARLQAALAEAALATPVDSEHGRRTRALALAALRADRRGGWQLRESPARLRVQTIDSLCAELSRQMPLLSGSGGELQVAEDADELYAEAVDALLAEAGEAPVRDDLAQLLLHLDNDWNAAAALLAQLLRRREQWQPLVGGGQGAPQRAQLDALLEALADGAAARLRELLRGELDELDALMQWRHAQQPASAAFDGGRSAAGWNSLCDLLLTTQGEWRRRLDRRQGFPAGGGDARALRGRMQALVEALRERDDGTLLAALRQFRELPDPEADPRHWATLRALLRLLPRLGAQLLLCFRRRGRVDHSQVALAALAALGDDDAPTELALRLDYRIEHLLVDEFQDTSSGQFELLRRLTRGWAEHNGQQPAAPRTLMLVGDAMQSIYGFREANVGLFIRARDAGLGDLPLESLELQANFRSRAAIVDWVNARFAAVFPPRDDPGLGAVRHRRGVPLRSGGAAPELRLLVGEAAREAEHDWVCARLEEALADPGAGSIAVLGRSRRQLQPLLARMRARGIPYAGRDLDPLAGRPVVRDLLLLCRLLQQYHDAYAWLSFLRAPWAALDHRDLLALSTRLPVAAAALQASPQALAGLGLSDAGAARLAQLLAVLRWAEHFRDRMALRVWVEECWLRLGGPAAAGDDGARDDAEQFLQLVEALEQQGAGLDARRLQAAARRLHAAPGDPRAAVQVMTLHKAKGLEFDRVFLPGLDAVPRRDDDELLLWEELLLDDGSPAFLLDVRARAGAGAARRVYDFLRSRRARRRELEDRRLLYVGCTRAAERLFLSAALPQGPSGEPAAPRRGSLLAALLPALDRALPPEAAPGGGARSPDDGPGPAYLRLSALPVLDPVPPAAAARGAGGGGGRLQRVLGSALHRATQSLLQRPVLPARCDAPLKMLLRQALRELGCEPRQLAQQQERGEAMLQRLLADPWARWMLDPARPQRTAEFPLVLRDGAVLRSLVVDYSFIDERHGERWVVDYKSAAPQPGETPEAFLAAAVAEHTPQLRSYACALAAIGPQPVRAALYFLALGRHHEVPVEP